MANRCQATVFQSQLYWGTVLLIATLISVAGMRFTVDRVFPREVVHLHDWPQFYKTSVRGYGLWLPDKAVILDAVERPLWPMGEEIVVRFKLPATNPPARWVKQIALKSGLEVKQHPYLYEANLKKSDYRKIEYLPEDDLYVIFGSWD